MFIQKNESKLLTNADFELFDIRSLEKLIKFDNSKHKNQNNKNPKVLNDNNLAYLEDVENPEDLSQEQKIQRMLIYCFTCWILLKISLS